MSDSAGSEDQRDHELYQQAALALEQGDLEHADHLFMSLLEERRHSGDSLGLSQVSRELALLAQRQGNDARAAFYIHQAADYFKQLGDGAGAAGVLRDLALAVQQQGNVNQAAALSRDALSLVQGLKGGRDTVQVLRDLAVAALRRGDLLHADDLTEKATDLLHRSEDFLGIAELLRELALLAQQRGNVPQTTRWAGGALEALRDVGDRRGAATFLGHLALAAQQAGNTSQATQWANDALDVFRSTGDREDAAKVLVDLAQLARQQRRGKQATEWARQALETYQDLGDASGTATAQLELAKIEGSPDEASSWASRALDNFRSAGDDDGTTRALLQLTQISLHIGDTAQATDRAEQALRIYLRTGDHGGAGRILLELNNIAQKTGDEEQAARFADEALDHFLSAGDQAGAETALHRRANLAQQQGAFKQADDYIQRAVKLDLQRQTADPYPPQAQRESERVVQTEPVASVEVIPAVAPEVDGSPDALGRSGDARAIAALIASRSLEPPLAIGLFGEWGSGKTHFMHQIQASVQEFSSQSSPAIHRNVSHVWFNAWHYAENNLWASLLHHVWSSLHPKPNGNAQFLEAALAQVEGAQQVKVAAEEKAAAATADVSAAKHELEEAHERHSKAAADAARVRARDVIDLIRFETGDEGDTEFQDARKKFGQVTQELGIPAELETARGIADSITQARQLASRAHALAAASPWWKSPLACGFVSLVLIATGGVAAGAILHASHGWLASAVTASAQIAALSGGAAAWISRQVAIGRKLLGPAEKMQLSLDQRVAKLQADQLAEIEKLQQRVSSEQARLEAAVSHLAEAEQQERLAKTELQELTGARLLRRYIAERAGTNDYQQYMGLIALAHRDLSELAQHLQRAAEDGTAEGAVERIVLYIDDLDRCSPATVTRVLEAVHLLLALPLFVAVVGVDRRWLDRSLLESHAVLLKSKDDETSPRDYLDKIFHLTYSLPPITADGAARLITSRLPTPPSASGGDHQEESSTEISDGSILSIESRARASLADSPGFKSAAPAINKSLEGLRLSQMDNDALSRVAPLVSSSPRRVTRFLSTYLVVRARVIGDPDVGQRLETHGEESDGIESLALLIALIFGVPATARDLRNPNFPGQSTVGEWFNDLLLVAHMPRSERARLTTFLTQSGSSAALPTSAVLGWLPLVLPYTNFVLDMKSEDKGEPDSFRMDSPAI